MDGSSVLVVELACRTGWTGVLGRSGTVEAGDSGECGVGLSWLTFGALMG